jgi:hypothetical protein
VETDEEWQLVFDVGWRTARAVSNEASAQLPDDVDIHSHDTEIFVYARSEQSVRNAEEVVSRLLEERGASTASTLTRWNPATESWQDPSLPVEPPSRPIDPAWAALGELAWEVRVRSQDGREARKLAQDLAADGHPTITGLGKRLTVGVADQSEAAALASELRLRAPTARIETRPLTRWHRWLIRQRALGNYGDGGGGGDEFGGGGNGGG